MKKKVLSIMLAAAMTLSVSAFATAVTSVNNTTVAFADATNSLNLQVSSTNILFPNDEYEGVACLGDTIHYNAIANGNNVKYDISISMRNGMGRGNASYTDLSGACDMSWTPEYAGLYQITITAKNTETGASETKYLHFHIKDSLVVNSLNVENVTKNTINNNISARELTATAKDEINISANSQGGAGQVVYTYTVTPRNGRYNSSYTYTSTDGKFKFIPSFSNFYQVEVTAKDQLGHTSNQYVYFAVDE